MKRFLTLLTAVLLTVTILPCAGFAADGSLANFKSDGEAPVFSDVLPEDWFFDAVEIVSKAGLMIGTGGNRFAPEAFVTKAEVCAIAARIHATYLTGSAKAADAYDSQANKPWYDRYVRYCQDNDGILEIEPREVTKPWLRYNCVMTLSRALPVTEFTAINAVTANAIPGLPSLDTTEDIYMLYRAGVLTGMDDAGSFCPEAMVRRCEVAAIVSRMIDPSLRVSVSGLTHTAEDMNISLTAEEAAELLRVALTEAYENIYGTFVPLDSKPEEYVPDAEYLRWVISHLEVSEETEDGYTFPVIFPFFVDRYSGMICKVYNGLNPIMTEFDPLSPSALSFAG